MSLLEAPQRLRVPPARERGRRVRALAVARRSPVGRTALAIGRLDQRLLLRMRTHWRNPRIERTAQALGTFGEFGAGWTVLGLGGAVLSPAGERRLLHAAGAAPVAVAINALVKAAVGRDRPVIEGHPALGPAPTKLSFPSTHATSSVAGAVALGRAAPGARVPLCLLAALICAGRPYLGMHYPSDVLAGVAIGYAIGRAYPLPQREEPGEAAP